MFFWSKFSRQMRVYQAHISQNKLEIAHLQLDLDWCNRRLLWIMGVAGSRKGKGSSKFAGKKLSRSETLLESVGICWMCVVLKCWNLVYRICRSAVNFFAVPCVNIHGEVWVSTGFHRFPPPNQARPIQVPYVWGFHDWRLMFHVSSPWAPGIDQHWKVLRNGARSYKLRRGEKFIASPVGEDDLTILTIIYGMVILCEVNRLTIKHRTSKTHKTHEYEWCLMIGDSSNQDQLGNIRGSPIRNQPLERDDIVLNIAQMSVRLGQQKRF